MNQWHLAVDLGASSGRHILGCIDNGKLITEEVYRFDNSYEDKNGTFCWDSQKLFFEIKKGLAECKKLGKIPATVAIDTWGVDFALIDTEGRLVGDTVSYRDSRTDGIQDAVHSIIDEQALFRRTGIQSHQFNTLYQLYSLKLNHPELLEKADKLLFLPDYFAYLLSGEKLCEYTIASTSEMLSLSSGGWDEELLNTLGIDSRILLPITKPCTVVAPVTDTVAEEIGYRPTVILAAAHDTGSAVVSVPSREENTLYISSGTWSLMGIESPVPFTSEKTRLSGFSNEGGCGGKYRVLKNIMGLWLIQSVRHELEDKFSFKELCELAEESGFKGGVVDVCDDRFLAPKSMIEEIKQASHEAGYPVPETPGQLAWVVYHSLASAYAESAADIEAMTGKSFSAINVIGGGSNADYLNRLTAQYAKKTVLAGPSEATAIGNLCAQLIACGELNSITEARELVTASFDIRKYS